MSDVIFVYNKRQISTVSSCDVKILIVPYVRCQFFLEEPSDNKILF